MTIHRGLVLIAALAGLLGTSRTATASSDGDGGPSPGQRSADDEVVRYRRVAFICRKKIPVLVSRIVRVRVLGRLAHIKVREVVVHSVSYTAYRLVPEFVGKTTPRMRVANTRE